MTKVVIYSSSLCGLEMRSQTTSLQSLVFALTKETPPVVLIDKDADARKFVFSKTDIRGVFPLLFVDDAFVGTYDDVRDMHDAGELVKLLQ